DGNTVPGDGCSASCDSRETCGNGIVDLVRGEECDLGILGLSNDGCSSTCKTELVRWRDVSPGPIGARASAAIAYDSAHARIVVFGGYADSTLLDDTWVRSGTHWTRQVPLVSPPARSGAVMIYDPDRDRVVLFGGVGSSGPLADTWQWDGTSWSELHPAES